MTASDASARVSQPAAERDPRAVDVKAGPMQTTKEVQRPFVQPLRKSHIGLDRPPFECIALLLQGGGALGAF
ncbi:MAG TPA: hypothetical protein VH397_19045, partial [Xanthobacteraceae bacterium]